MSEIMGDKAVDGGSETNHTADDFAEFFANKVDSVRQSTSSTPKYEVPHTARHVLDEWAAVTISDVEKLISSAVSKTCQFDPAPTWLIKECLSLIHI